MWMRAKNHIILNVNTQKKCKVNTENWDKENS